MGDGSKLSKNGLSKIKSVGKQMVFVIFFPYVATLGHSIVAIITLNVIHSHNSTKLSRKPT